MTEMWEIPCRDKQTILTLVRQDDESKIPKTRDGIKVEITKIENSHLTKKYAKAAVGSLSQIQITGQEAELTLNSDWGARYIGRIEKKQTKGLGQVLLGVGGEIADQGLFLSQYPDKYYGFSNEQGSGSSRPFYVANSKLYKGFYFLSTVEVEFKRDPNTPDWVIPIYLPLFRIHRPHLAGCTAEATITTTEKVETDTQYEFAGLKGGGGLGFTTQMSTKIQAGSICKEEAIPAKLVVEHGTTLVDGKPVASGTRYRVVEADPDARITRPIPAGIDSCLDVLPANPKPRPQFWGTFDKTKVPANDSDSDTEGAKLGSTGYISVGIGAEIGSAPFKLSVEMKRTLELEYEVKTVLKGGAKYLRSPIALSSGFFPFEICWNVL